MRSLASKPIAAIAALILSAGLSACAVHKPATLQVSDAGVQTISAIELTAVASDDSLRAQWSAALGRAFQMRSVQIADPAPFIADFALSVREAQFGLAKPTDAKDDIEWQSVPRDNRFLDRCKAKRLRGTLVIFERATGKIAYKGESEADGCDFEQVDFDAMAAQLVSDATK